MERKDTSYFLRRILRRLLANVLCIQEGIEEIDSESGALGQGNILSSTESDDETIDDDIDDGSLYSQ